MNIMQHIIVTCDDYIQKADVPPRSRDRACADFISGALNALQFAPHGFNPPLPEIMERMYLVNLGGYARIHYMAEEARKDSAPVPAQRRKGA